MEKETNTKDEKAAATDFKVDVKKESCCGMNSDSIKVFLGVLLVLSVLGNVYLYSKVNELNNVIAGAIIQPGKTTETTVAAPVKSSVNFDLYVMSYCPYGTQVEDALFPVIKKFGGVVALSLNFIANENADGTFQSLHGQVEVDENIRQLCAIKYYPTKYMDFILCRNKDISSSNWEPCATEAGFDASKIKTCAEGSEGKKLLSDSIKKTDEVGASGSPTMYINDEPYQGSRDEISFTRAICKYVPDNENCKDIPACATDADCTAVADKVGKCMNSGEKNAKCEYVEPVKIEFTVLNDKNCASCDTANIVSVTEQLFKGLVVKEVDYNTAEGKDLVKKFGITILPAYIFDANVANGESFARVAGALIKQGDSYIINPQATGASYYIGREEKKNTLDLFVMSFCPYGTQAEKSLKEVLDLFGSKLTFNLHFIASENSDGTFNSLHGQTEVDEDLRQVCAIKYYPTKYFSYVLCRDNDINADWKSCTDSTGLDTAKIEKCATGDEGKKLLSADIKIGSDLGIGSSPTFLINNRNAVSGAMPSDTIKENICASNPALAGCDKTLSGAGTAPVASGGCG